MKRKPNRSKHPKPGFQLGVDWTPEEQLQEYMEQRDEQIMEAKVEKGEIDPEELQRTIEEEE